ncbi:MAG: hypothetical protein ACLQAH_07015, partial [Limisphaerales bacterium]
FGVTQYDPGIIYGAGMFLTFGTNIQNKANYILKSTNGISWTTIYSSSNALIAAAYGNNTWVFIGPNEIVAGSMTSSNWNWTQFQPGFSPSSIAYGNGTFVIAAYWSGVQSIILSSTDGIVWNYDSTLPLGYPSGIYVPMIAYGNGVFVTSGENDKANPVIDEVFASSNLILWTTNIICSTPSETYFHPINYGGNQFIGEYGTNVWTSINAIDWTNRFPISYDPLPFFTYGAGTFLVVSNYGQNIYQSGVFGPQSNSPATTLTISTYPGVTINGSAGAVYQIQSTTNLNSTWQPLTNLMLPFSPYIWVDTSPPAVGQKFYRSVQLQ